MSSIFDFIKWLFPDPKKNGRMIIAFFLCLILSFGGSFFSYKFSVAKAQEKITIAEQTIHAKVESESKAVQQELKLKQELVNLKLDSNQIILLAALNNIQANQKRNAEDIKSINQKIWQIKKEVTK